MVPNAGLTCSVENHRSGWLGQSEAVPQSLTTGASLRSATSHPRLFSRVFYRAGLTPNQTRSCHPVGRAAETNLPRCRMDIPVRLGLTDKNVHPTGKLRPAARLGRTGSFAENLDSQMSHHTWFQNNSPIGGNHPLGWTVLTTVRPRVACRGATTPLWVWLASRFSYWWCGTQGQAGGDGFFPLADS